MPGESWYGDLLTEGILPAVREAIEEHLHREESLTLHLGPEPFPGVVPTGLDPAKAPDFIITEEMVDRYGAIQIRTIPQGTSQTNPYIIRWPSTRVNIQMVVFFRGQGWLRIMTDQALDGRGRAFANVNRTVLMANGAGTEGQFNSLILLATDPQRLSSIPLRPDIDDAVGNATTDMRGLGEVATVAEVEAGEDADPGDPPRFVTPAALAAELGRRIGIPAAPDAPTFSNVGSTAFTATAALVSLVTKWRARWRAGSSGSWTLVAEQATRAFRITGRSSGTTYQVQVAQGNAQGWSPYGATGEVTTVAVVPSTPGRPSISLITSSSFRATAASGGGATRWRAQWREGTSGDWIDVAEQTSRFFDVSGLAASTRHQVRYARGNSAGWSAYGPAATVTTTSGLPARPSAPTISNRSGSGFRVTAAAGGSGITQYRAQYRVGTSGGWTALAAQSGRVWNVTGRSANTSHQVQVAVRNSVGWSPWSTSATARTTAPPPSPPATPASLTLTPSTTSVRGTIAAVSGSGVSYEWRRGSSGGYTAISGGGRTFTDTGLTPNSAYSYSCRARNAAGPSGVRTASTRTTIPAPSTAPVVSTTSIVNGVRFSWPSVRWAQWYERQGRASTRWVNSGSVRTYTAGVRGGTDATLRFRARNATGPGPASGYVTGRAGLGAPTGVRLSGRLTGSFHVVPIALQWNRPNYAQVSWYRVQYREAVGAQGAFSGWSNSALWDQTTVTSVSGAWSLRTRPTRLQFRVAAETSDGTRSVWANSNIITFS